MGETPPLWHATFRKEAMDLLAQLWTTLEAEEREALAACLLEGPPDDLLAEISPDEREKSRDRRVFDRIVVLERLDQPPLTASLVDRMAQLRENYPEWRSAPGERAHFGSWMEMRWGPDTLFSVDDLLEMDEADLLDRLRTDQDRREGLLDVWRQFVQAWPRHGLNALKALAASPDPGPSDAWEYGLLGLRDAENAGLVTNHMLGLLAEVPDALFLNQEMVRAASDLLEAKSKELRIGGEPLHFWNLFDRTLAACDDDHTKSKEILHGQVDWVSEAINSSLGRIATAWINALFARRPKAAEGLPKEFAERGELLMAPDRPDHRLARVIGASRISYLFAIDPTWTLRTLIPSFDWSDEEETIAMWQAYAWQARIDPQLWSALKHYFLPLFRSDRLERMGLWGRNIAQSLMLVGVAFSANELKRDAVRNAIRAMPESMRVEAAAWVSGYMEAGEDDNHDEDEEPIPGSPDDRWEKRISPWLKRVWPTEATLRSPSVAEQFALAAIATEDAFPAAVESIQPFAAASDGYRLINRIAQSDHPERHPRSVLVLIDSFIARDQMWVIDDEFAVTLSRMSEADPELLEDNRYQSWMEIIKVNQF